MQKPDSINLLYASYGDARKCVQALCEVHNLDNWDGKEAGGVGYDYRVNLEQVN
jgi:hypothetical protein